MLGRISAVGGCLVGWVYTDVGFAMLALWTCEMVLWLVSDVEQVI